MIAEQGHLQVQLARMIVEQVGFELDGPNLQWPEGVQYVVGYRPTSADKLTRWFGSCPMATQGSSWILTPFGSSAEPYARHAEALHACIAPNILRATGPCWHY